MINHNPIITNRPTSPTPSKLGIILSVPQLDKLSLDFSANEESRHYDKLPYVTTYLSEPIDTRDIKLSLPEGCLELRDDKNVRGGRRSELEGLRVVMQSGDRVMLGGSDDAAKQARAAVTAWAAAAFPDSAAETAAMIATAAAVGASGVPELSPGEHEEGGAAAPRGGAGPESRNLASPDHFVLDRPFTRASPAGTLVRLFRNKSNLPATHLDPLILLGLKQSALTKRQRAILARMRYVMAKGHRTKEDLENTDFCAKIIQKACRDYLHRRAAYEAMLPIRAAKARALQLITWVQAVVRGRRGRREVLVLMKRRIAVAEEFASFNLRMHMLMYICRFRRRKKAQLQDVVDCLAACLVRRAELVARRRREAITGLVLYGVARPGPPVMAVAGARVGLRGSADSPESANVSNAASPGLGSSLYSSLSFSSPALQPHTLDPHGTHGSDMHAPLGITHALVAHALEELDERRRHGGLVKRIKRGLGGGAGGLSRLIQGVLQVHDGDGEVGLAGLGVGMGAGSSEYSATGRRGAAGGLAASAVDVAAGAVRRRAVAQFVMLKEREQIALLAAEDRYA